MNTFLLGVLSSWLASVLAVLIGWLVSRRTRRWLGALPLRLGRTGIIYRYPTQREANADLPDVLSRARWVKVLAGRGNELTRDSFKALWQGGARRLDAVQVLLPDPDATGRSWLAEREAETIRHDPGYRPGLLADQVKANIDYLGEAARHHSNVVVRLFNLPNLGRVVVTDRVAYLTLYDAGEHGRNSTCLVAGPGPVYDFALRMFETAWMDSVPLRGREPSDDLD